MENLNGNIREVEKSIARTFGIHEKDIILDSPSNYQIKYHGKQYSGEFRFTYTLPQELISYTHLLAEPYINVYSKKRLRSSLKWFLYCHPKKEKIVREIINDYASKLK